MKIVKAAILSCTLTLLPLATYAQQAAEYVVNMDSMVFNPSQRIVAMGQNSRLPLDPAWSKTIYRFVALNDPETIDQNGYLAEPRNPVLYHTEAGGVKQKRYYYNLISIILRLLDEQKISGYLFDTDAIDEAFSPAERLTPDSALMKLGLVRDRRNPKFTQADFAYAGSGVNGYLIKEVWFYDARKSHFGTEVVAIAPVFQDAASASEFTPAFWVTYESLRPYFSQLALKTESRATTFDSYFTKRAYSGLIYRAQGANNQTLWSKCAQEIDPQACRKAESDRIDEELRMMYKQVWNRPLKTVEPTPQEKKAQAAADKKARIEAEKAKIEAEKQAKKEQVKIQNN